MDLEARTRIEHLERALETRGTVGQALGILMERYEIDQDRAFSLLRRSSSMQGRRLAEVAQRLIATRRLEGVEVEPCVVEGQPEMPAGAMLDKLGLSARERQVVALIASGASNEDIAATLFLGINTVKTYIRTAYRKIGVTRRPQAIIWARELGLVALDSAEGGVDDLLG